jgi:RNA polymerase sigma-70 factor (ECF subfamily)
MKTYSDRGAVREASAICAADIARDAQAIRRLARALVRDPDIVEDVRQDASIAVLRGPKPITGARRAWLATVVLNSLRLRLRKKSRLERADSAAAREVFLEEVASPETLIERAQTRTSVARAVLDLQEPFRSTVLLRFYEGLMPSEIARMKNVPAGTVRWRLKVGLDRLRASLDARHGGDRDRWVLLVAPLALTMPSGGPSRSIRAPRFVFLTAVATLVPLALLPLGWRLTRPHAVADAGASAALDPLPPRLASRRAAIGTDEARPPHGPPARDCVVDRWGRGDPGRGASEYKPEEAERSAGASPGSPSHRCR